MRRITSTVLGSAALVLMGVLAGCATPGTTVVTPASDLVEGQSVTVSGDGYPAGADVTVAQCPATATALAECDETTAVHTVANPDGTYKVRFTVHAQLDGGHDCRGSLGCAIGSAVGTRKPVLAAISFLDPVLTVTPSTDLVEGQVVRVDGTGFREDAPIFVLECPTGVPALDDCDSRNGRTARTDAGGQLTTLIEMHAELVGGNGHPTDCRVPDACVVLAFDEIALELITAPVHFTP